MYDNAFQKFAFELRNRAANYELDGGMVRGDSVYFRVAAEIEELVRAHYMAMLSPKEAAQECALAEKTIRKMLADGRLQNAGSPGRPKVRRGELHAAANRSVARRLHVV